MSNLVTVAWMKWGMLGGLSLALVACGGQAAPEASDQPTVATISGKISVWTGEGRVTVPGLPGVSSSVRSDGTFTLTLPSDDELSGQTVSADGIAAKVGCSGSIQSSAPDLQTYAVMSVEARDSAGNRVASAVTGSKPGLLSRRVNAHIWLYSDSVTQLRGTMDCAALLRMAQIPTLPVTVAINAKPGWNVVELNITASANVLAQVSASGSLVNSGAGSRHATFRTVQELQAQVAF
ncbi:hypothetical protein [Deinococcus aerolatus]|uniref:hypothetical protein n=1 Tax=Deinococcus aerolatus TaxID=522487 RepID=UPI001E4F4541|nr:hypothetical protein [Deinococcus aerolatus]